MLRAGGAVRRLRSGAAHWTSLSPSPQLPPVKGKKKKEEKERGGPCSGRVLELTALFRRLSPAARLTPLLLSLLLLLTPPCVYCSGRVLELTALFPPPPLSPTARAPHPHGSAAAAGARGAGPAGGAGALPAIGGHHQAGSKGDLPCIVRFCIVMKCIETSLAIPMGTLRTSPSSPQGCCSKDCSVYECAVLSCGCASRTCADPACPCLTTRLRACATLRCRGHTAPEEHSCVRGLPNTLALSPGPLPGVRRGIAPGPERGGCGEHALALARICGQGLQVRDGGVLVAAMRGSCAGRGSLAKDFR